MNIAPCHAIALKQPRSMLPLVTMHMWQSAITGRARGVFKPQMTQSKTSMKISLLTFLSAY